MTIQEAKQISIADYLQSMGYSPVKQQGESLWYKSPFRQETEASFKVNIELNPCDFGSGRGRKRQELTVNPPPRNIVKPKKKDWDYKASKGKNGSCSKLIRLESWGSKFMFRADRNPLPPTPQS